MVIILHIKGKNTGKTHRQSNVSFVNPFGECVIFMCF